MSQSPQVRAVHTLGEPSDLVSLHYTGNSSNTRGVDIATSGYDGGHSVYHRVTEICAVWRVKGKNLPLTQQRRATNLGQFTPNKLGQTVSSPEPSVPEFRKVGQAMYWYGR